MKTQKHLLFLFILCFSYNGLAQNGKYLIISIIKSNNSRLDGFGQTQWIIPEDSLGKSIFNYESILPLFIEDYSFDLIQDCKENKSVDPFTLTTETNYKFSDSISKNILQLSNFISKNRKLIQTIDKKWSTKYKEKLKIYATPVEGNFCKCIYKNSSNVAFSQSNYIYISYDTVAEIKNFWKSISAKNLKNLDFSIKYSFQRMWH